MGIFQKLSTAHSSPAQAGHLGSCPDLVRERRAMFIAAKRFRDQFGFVISSWYPSIFPRITLSNKREREQPVLKCYMQFTLWDCFRSCLG